MEVDQGVKRNKKIHACTFDGCSAAFERPYRLAQHRLVHDNVKPFTCGENNCGKAYTSKSHLIRHLKTAHIETSKNLPFCCPKCNKQYVNRQNLKRHIKVSHTENNKPFNCSFCRQYFKKAHQLRAHTYVHNGVKQFRCRTCDREFVTLYEKKKHMKNHKVYECEHCEEKFTRWTDLMHHKRVDHVSPEYVCHDCGKVFKGRGHIIRHVKKHLPNTPVTVFFCQYNNCLRQYSSSSNLKQHVLVKHKGVTFDCSHCGAKLSTKAKLKEHIDRHKRSNLPPIVHKTLKTGRKKRKDAGKIRHETAFRLAGIVIHKNKDGTSKHYTKDGNWQKILRNRCNNKKDLVNKINNNSTVEQTSLRDVESDLTKPKPTIELKVEADYSSNSLDFRDKFENTTSELSSLSQCINEGDISSRLSNSVNINSVNKQPSSLIEILNRPIKVVNHEISVEDTSNFNRSISVEVKIEADGDNSLFNFDCANDSEKTDISNQPVTDIPISIKVEHNTEEQNDINENDALDSLKTPSLPKNKLSSLMQLYWKTIMNHKDVD